MGVEIAAIPIEVRIRLKSFGHRAGRWPKIRNGQQSGCEDGGGNQCVWTFVHTAVYGIRNCKSNTFANPSAAHFSRVIPLGYANAIIGYVPVDRQLPERGYEVIGNQRSQLRTGAFEVGTEDRVIQAVKSTVEIA